MNSVLVKIWLGVLLLALGGYGGYTALRLGGMFDADEKPEDTAPKIVELKLGDPILPALADVKLIQSSGANMRWEELKGQPWVANVFFATCPTECILISHQMRNMQFSIPGVRFVSITCDPERDTLGALQKYAAQYHADPTRWFFARGEMTEINRASEAIFGFGVKRVQHLPYLVLIDREGKFVGMYSGISKESMDELREKLMQLTEPAPRAPEPDITPGEMALSTANDGQGNSESNTFKEH
jgi:protein SCO1/2